MSTFKIGDSVKFSELFIRKASSPCEVLEKYRGTVIRVSSTHVYVSWTDGVDKYLPVELTITSGD